MQSLNQCTSLCWPNVVLGMEASTLWSRIKRGLCGSDVETTLCQARSTPTGTKVTSELSKSDFVLLYLSFHWRPSVFTHFLVPKKHSSFFFGCSRESRIQLRIMVHWIPSLLFFPRTRITFNKLCSKPKTTPEKEEWKIPQKTVSERKKNIKKLHSSTSCFENLFWVSLWCLKTKWMPSLRLSSPFLESFVFKVNSKFVFFL